MKESEEYFVEYFSARRGTWQDVAGPTGHSHSSRTRALGARDAFTQAYTKDGISIPPTRIIRRKVEILDEIS